MAISRQIINNENMWHRLDNAAKIYPAISSSGGSIFRVAVQLKAEVNPQILQDAVNITLPRFPTFAVKMKRGLFWYYFEPNHNKPIVTVEGVPPCRAIEIEETNGFLFRVSYYKKRISLEMFHALTDGTGALTFLKSLVFQYLSLSGYGVFSDGNVLDHETQPSAGEIEDSFNKYYNPRMKCNRSEEKAYHICGTRTSPESIGIVHGIAPLESFIRLVKKNKASVTEYIAALIIYSIYSTQLKNRKCAMPVKVSVPVNLRKIFPSQTLRNFFSHVNVGLAFTDGDYSFEGILDVVRGRMREEIQPAKLIEKISANVKAEKNIFMRLVPLPIKNVVLKLALNAYGESLFTCSLSNLGPIPMPEAMAEHLKRFEFVLGPPAMNLLNCSVCSFKDDIIMTFTKAMYETDIERFLFRFLAEKGLDVTIETN